MARLFLGTARARLGPAAALIDHDHGRVAACEENRLTRARHAETAGPPELAIAELLRYLRRSAGDIASAVTVDEEAGADPHPAHAAYAFAASGFDAAVVIVVDARISVWTSDGTGALTPAALDGLDLAITQRYGALAERLGLRAMRDEHLVEALARTGHPDAASTQHALGKELLQLLQRVQHETGQDRACLSGGLFFNTYFTTLAAGAGIFTDVFVPPHPGRNGAALGGALLADGGDPARAPQSIGSPYLGPSYDDAEIKAALENCKLSFDLLHDERLFEQVRRALSRGRLVGWYHGRLEWGPRALGHRSVLADPRSPHVLENLNGFLKQRPAYRTYGVSVPRARLADLFETNGHPAASPFMQFEYTPRDPDTFRTILPEGVRTLRVHTVDDSEPRFLQLLEQWGQETGTPVLVNTSFNGFHEPLVCSPRDAIRVFYGTGLDLLALENFLLHK